MNDIIKKIFISQLIQRKMCSQLKIALCPHSDHRILIFKENKIVSNVKK